MERDNFIEQLTSGKDYESLYENAKSIVSSFNFEEYEDIVFVAKSIGTIVAYRLKEELNVGHRMEVKNDIERNLQIIRNVVKKLDKLQKI